MGTLVSAVCEFIFELLYASAVSYARVWQKHPYLIFSYDTETTPDTSESTCHTPGPVTTDGIVAMS